MLLGLVPVGLVLVEDVFLLLLLLSKVRALALHGLIARVLVRPFFVFLEVHSRATPLALFFSPVFRGSFVDAFEQGSLFPLELEVFPVFLALC